MKIRLLQKGLGQWVVMFLALIVSFVSHGQGSWDAQSNVEVAGVHGVVMPVLSNHSSQVMYFPYRVQNGNGTSVLVTPGKGTGSSISYALKNATYNMFCSGNVLLPDGKVMFNGGQAHPTAANSPAIPGLPDDSGLPYVQLFDNTLPAGSEYSIELQMNRQRYYPSTVTDGNGDVWVFGGEIVVGESEPSVEWLNYTSSSTTGLPRAWRNAGSATVLLGRQWDEAYPRVFLLGDGNFFIPGHVAQSYVFESGDATGSVQGRVTNVSSPGVNRGNGASIRLLDGRIMNVGGDHEGVGSYNDYQIINFGRASMEQFVANNSGTHPSWDPVQNVPMGSLGRVAPLVFIDGTLLPDGTVMITGGDPDAGASARTPLLFNPQNNSWSALPQHTQGRGYHSSTLLLPDGRVIIHGGDGNNGPGGYNESTFVQIYNPAYLDNASARPTNVRLNVPGTTTETTVAQYGESVTVTWNPPANGNAISHVVLMRPGGSTHSFTYDQRGEVVNFDAGTVTASSGTFTLPSRDGTGAGESAKWKGKNVFPPGYYMAFLMTANGIPADARWIQIGITGHGGTGGGGNPCAGAQANIPAALNTQNNSCNTIALTWTAPTDASCVTGYQVQRSINNGANWQTLNANVTGGTTFTDNTPNAGSNLYQVRANNSNGSPSGYIQSVTVSCTPAAQYSITINNPTNGGITLDPANGPYTAGSFVTVTAVNNTANYTFSSWTGDLASSNSTNPVQLQMDGNKTIGATFTQNAPVQYLLTTAVNDGNGGNVDPGALFNAGSVATINAYLNTGYQFDGWTGDVAGATINGTEIQVPMTSIKNIQANFSLIPIGGGGCAGLPFNNFVGAGNATNVTVTTSSVDETATGQKTVDGSGLSNGAHNGIWNNAWISAGTSNQWILYNLGRVYPLGAFDIWNYNEAGITNRGVQNITISYSTNGTSFTTLGSYVVPQASGATSYTGVKGLADFAGVQAQYVRINVGSNYGEGWGVGIAEVQFNLNCSSTPPALYSLTTSAGTGGTVSPNGTSNYPAGNVSIMADPINATYRFVQWTGNVPAAQINQNPLQLLIDGNKTVQAVFEQIPQQTQYTITASANVAGRGMVSGSNTYNSGSPVVVSASANPGFTFTGWSGTLSGINTSGTTLNFTATSDRTITANFSLDPCASAPAIPATASFSGNCTSVNISWTTSTCATSYRVQRRVGNSGPWTTLPGAGSVTGLSYTDNIPGSNASQNQYRVRAQSSAGNSNNRTASGSVTCSGGGGTLTWQTAAVTYVGGEPEGSGRFVEAGATATFTYTGGNFRINVSESEGGAYTTNVSSGSKSLSAGQNPLSPALTGTAQRNVTLTFSGEAIITSIEVLASSGARVVSENIVPITHTLTASAENGVVPMNGQEILTDLTVLVTAKADAGYQFVNWEGDYEGTENPALVHMNETKSLKANFAPLSTGEWFKVDDQDVEVEYNGNWSSPISGTPDSYLGTQIWSYAGKAEMSYKFTGTKARVYLYQVALNQAVNVSIDGGAKQLVNLEASNDFSSVMVWESEELSDTEHTMTVERVSGDVRIDAIEFFASDGLASLANQNGSISVYPNPVKDYTNISLPKDFEGVLKLSLYDMNGRRILEDQRVVNAAENRLQRLDLPKLDGGLYQLMLIMNGEIEVMKLIK